MFKLSFIILALMLTLNVLAIQSPHGKMLSTKCDVCHVTGGWTKIKDGSFNHNDTSFPLKGQHQTVSCKKCHVDLVFSNAKKECNACHTDVHQQTVGGDCQRCHTESSWIVPNISQLHEQSRFPLRDSHKKADCNQCHKSASTLRFDPMNSECVDCHLADYNSNPTHVSNNFSKECASCHTGKNWESSTFDHNTTTFPLTGSHIGVDCKKCHANGYSGTSTECVSCHLVDYNATIKPNHTLAKISTDCKTCHNVNDWSPAKFDHDVNTTFPLTGSHKSVDCIKCHANGYVNTPSTCVSCHKTNFDATINPNHVANKFSTDCQTCHNVTAWQPSTFNHNTTAFPLTGSHKGVDCIKCHANGYVNTPSTCVSCHKTNFDATTNPNHLANKFSTDCQTCHNVTAWQPSTFNHNTTAFPLTGSHTTVSCATCHTKGYKLGDTHTTCIGCHKTNFDATSNPVHTAANFKPEECESCHSTKSWIPTSFNHNTSTQFVLKGSHIGLSCNSCHAKGYKGIGVECISCHQTNYNNTINPNHVTAKFSTDCKTCHTETAWQPSTFNHNTSTSFPLTDSHIGVDCIKCHTNGYSNTSSECVSCHQTNYNNAINPNHAVNKFSTDCKTCHNVKAWQPSTFNHATTSFPLTGLHAGVDCVSCHTKGYKLGDTPTRCEDCHKTKAVATTNPNHTTANFLTSCETCHTTSGWLPSKYVHPTTFKLTGGHGGLTCNNCHLKGYTNTSTACVSCHLADYNATKSPAHAAAKFPQTCELCHTISGWIPAKDKNHDGQYFRIYSGRHKGKWSQCTECHNNASNYAVFSCIMCHEHSNKASVDADHKDEIKNGYVYSATSCMQCHSGV